LNDKYLTVTALTRYIKRKIDLDSHLQNIWLKGEISNFKHHSRGHMYLTIKDAYSRIQAVMFSGNNRHLKFMPENGMNVFIRGNISVYEANGQYQLYINEMEPDGLGALYLAYEQLKEKLLKRGYFNQERKKTIPLYPERIGVVTSPTGAAVRDIITTIKRRYPIVEIVVIPVLVQGPNAAASIANAIHHVNIIGGFDTLIVGRGGGSIEELWSFNEEIVANAIYYSEIPIISAVGHETDTTISDFVSDLRAPTPTGAAELAVPSQLELKNQIIQYKQRLSREMSLQLDFYKRQLKSLNSSYAFRYPKELLKQKEQNLDSQLENLEREMKQKLKEKKLDFQVSYNRLQLQHPNQQIEQASKALKELTRNHQLIMSQIVETNQLNVANLLEKLSLVSPLEIMKRGFALPYRDSGELLKSVQEVKQKDKITLKLNDGDLRCQVLTIKENLNE